MFAGRLLCISVHYCHVSFSGINEASHDEHINYYYYCHVSFPDINEASHDERTMLILSAHQAALRTIVNVKVLLLHGVTKNDTDVADYNFNTHQLILIMFGRDVAERVCYQTMICYPTSPD